MRKEQKYSNLHQIQDSEATADNQVAEPRLELEQLKGSLQEAIDKTNVV